jgi:hypothetical protein
MRHLQCFLYILIQEGMAQAAAGIGDQYLDRPLDGREHAAQFVDTLGAGEIALYGRDRYTGDEGKRTGVVAHGILA